MTKAILIGFVVLILSLPVINRFFYSWTGLLFSGLDLCQYRRVAVYTDNGRDKELKQPYSIDQITSAMKKNPNYGVRGYDGDGLIVSRVFNGVMYNINFRDRGGVSQFNLDNHLHTGYPHGAVARGERCTTPSYFMEKNVHSMIDDLPLNDVQKSELKQHVKAPMASMGKLF